MTNGDKIRSMTNEELAEFIYLTIEDHQWLEYGNNNYADVWRRWVAEEEKE